MASTTISASRAVKSCTECKQAKLRCDSKAKFPNPCTRCQTRQLLCTIDPTFQRTPAKKRLEAMTRELQELRNQRDGGLAVRSEASADPTPSPSENLAGDQTDDFDPVLDSFTLGNTVIEADSVVAAFKLFAELFRPQLPIGGAISVHRTYQSQSFLFWTIIVVVVSHIPGPPFEDMFARIEEPYMDLLRGEILSAPLPLHKIQALLYLCMWPIPVKMQQKDPSWLYCGIAINAARFMGLDRQQAIPSLRSQGVVAGDVQARTNTWLGCFYVGTSLALYLGLPPPIHSELDFTTIHALLSRKTAPVDFTALIQIKLIVAKFTNLLMHNLSEAASTSLIRLLDGELDMIKSGFPEEDSNARMIEYSILSSKLHFYALSITRMQPRTPSHDIMLRVGLTVALRLIHISHMRLCDTPVDTPDQTILRQQRCLPKTYYRGVAFAMAFLLKFFNLNGSAAQEEQQSAANHVMKALNIFRTVGTEDGDEYNRVVKFFSVMARLNPEQADPSKPRLTHRLGVSILLETYGAVYEAQGRSVELDENHTLHDKRPDLEEEEMPDAEPIYPESFEFDPTLLNFDVQDEVWNDPLWNMLSTNVGPSFFLDT